MRKTKEGNVLLYRSLLPLSQLAVVHDNGYLVQRNGTRGPNKGKAPPLSLVREQERELGGVRRFCTR